MSLRARIDSCVSKPVGVEVPEWGCTAFVRVLPCIEYDELVNAEQDAPAMRVVRIAAALLCDEAGNRLYGPDELDALGRQPLSDLTHVVNAGLAANGLNDTNLEDAMGNLSATPNEAGG